MHETGGERALPGARVGRKEQSPAVARNRARVNDEVLVSAVRNAPVEAPLEKRRRETLRKGLELTPAFLKEEDLRPVEAPEPPRGSESDVEIGDARIVFQE